LAADGIAYDRQAVAGDAAAYRQFVELLVPLVRGCWNPPSPLVPSIARDHRRTEKPHQRDRECLEQGKAAYAPLQRHTKAYFYLFLKECEWRFNHRPASNLLKTISEWIKMSILKPYLCQHQKFY